MNEPNSSAGSRTRRRSAPRLRAIDLGLALRHVQSTDLRELWVPDVLHFQDFVADAKTVQAEALHRIVQAGPFEPPVDVEVPKTPFFNRTASLLSFEDRIAYQGLVGTFADLVDAKHREGVVFSSRVSASSKYFLKNNRDQWLLFQRAIELGIESGKGWVIRTDLSSFFDTIPHPLLFGDLDSLGLNPVVSRALKRMLGLWTNDRGVGLLQGPNASRLLGNYYLHPVDVALRDGPWLYLRYMDDIRILGATRREATNGFRILERECKRRCLLLSPQKTKLMIGKDALADLADPVLAAADYLFKYRREASRPVLRRILARAMLRDAQLNSRHALFSIYRLSQLGDPPQSRVLGHLQDLAPVADVLAVFLRPWLRRPTVQRAISTFLHDPELNGSPFLSTWLMAVMMEKQGEVPDEWITYAREVTRDANQPFYHRAVAMNLVARGKMRGDVDWLQRTGRSSYEPTVVRGALVALARIGALDRSTASQAEAHVPATSRTVRYLTSRTTLPSLVKRGEWIPIDA